MHDFYMDGKAYDLKVPTGVNDEQLGILRHVVIDDTRDIERDWADTRWPRTSSFEDLERVYFPNKYTEETKKI